MCVQRARRSQRGLNYTFDKISTRVGAHKAAPVKRSAARARILCPRPSERVFQELARLGANCASVCVCIYARPTYPFTTAGRASLCFLEASIMLSNMDNRLTNEIAPKFHTMDKQNRNRNGSISLFFSLIFFHISFLISSFINIEIDFCSLVEASRHKNTSLKLLFNLLILRQDTTKHFFSIINVSRRMM